MLSAIRPVFIAWHRLDSSTSLNFEICTSHSDPMATWQRLHCRGCRMMAALASVAVLLTAVRCTHAFSTAGHRISQSGRQHLQQPTSARRHSGSAAVGSLPTRVRSTKPPVAAGAAAALARLQQTQRSRGTALSALPAAGLALSPVTQGWYLWTVLMCASSVGLWSEKTKWGAALSRCEANTSCTTTCTTPMHRLRNVR
jgi:hypothetical protein